MPLILVLAPVALVELVMYTNVCAKSMSLALRIDLPRVFISVFTLLLLLELEFDPICGRLFIGFVITERRDLLLYSMLII